MARFVNWGVASPQHAAEGFYQGITSATHEVIQALAGVVTEPVAGASKLGVRGAASGLAKGLLNLVGIAEASCVGFTLGIAVLTVFGYCSAGPSPN